MEKYRLRFRTPPSVVDNAPGNGMEPIGIFGCIQVEVPYRTVTVQIGGEEIGDVLPEIVVNRVSQRLAVHPNVDRGTIHGDLVWKGSKPTRS